MEKTVTLTCLNNGTELEVPIGMTLEEAFPLTGLKMKYGPFSARVNNKVEGMHYRIYRPKQVEFLDISSPSGNRAYTRTLFFILCKALHELYDEPTNLPPQGEAPVPAACKRVQVSIDIPVSNGYYVDVQMGRPVTLDDVGLIRKRMQRIVNKALPIHRYEASTDEVVNMFRQTGELSKVKLFSSAGRLNTIYYDIDGYKDYYYGSLLTNTRQVYLFGLEKYHDGLLLRIPSMEHPSELGEMTHQDKMFSIFKEHHRWQDILGIRTIGDLNEAVDRGDSSLLIQVSEALQEKKIAQIAEDIASRKETRIVLIAGPSSSGKTTTCKRLNVQLLTNGIKPVGISLDDYFVNREQTPRDAKGDYDFEHLHSLNLDLLNQQMNALLRGEEVELPKYNFYKGESERSGRKLRLQPGEVLVVEGIHALNPELTAHIPQQQIYRIYASALTTILLDNHNYIPTTDNRLLRRIVRDHKYRGVSAQETIRRWASVRAGENRWIFPFQENANAMFNTAMLFELAVLREQALPLLEEVPEEVQEYAEAYRLRKFLRYIRPIPNNEIPPTSLLREFLGGSSFKY